MSGRKTEWVGILRMAMELRKITKKLLSGTAKRQIRKIVMPLLMWVGATKQEMV